MGDWRDQGGTALGIATDGFITSAGMAVDRGEDGEGPDDAAASAGRDPLHGFRLGNCNELAAVDFWTEVLSRELASADQVSIPAVRFQTASDRKIARTRLGSFLERFIFFATSACAALLTDGAICDAAGIEFIELHRPPVLGAVLTALMVSSALLSLGSCALAGPSADGVSTRDWRGPRHR